MVELIAKFILKEMSDQELLKFLLYLKDRCLLLDIYILVELLKTKATLNMDAMRNLMTNLSTGEVIKSAVLHNLRIEFAQYWIR